MEITTLTDFRQNMKAYFDTIFKLGTPLFIARPKGKDMVIMCKDEYESMLETFHLLKSPANANRLLNAIEKDKKGEGNVRELLD